MNVNSLENWLDIATRDLCDAAKVRVCAEVNEHFSVAHNNAVRDGHNDEYAVGHALEDLGDPANARRRLNKLYLSPDELSAIRYVTELSASKAFRVFAIVALLFGTVIIYETVTTPFGTWPNSNYRELFRHFLQLSFFLSFGIIVCSARRLPRLAVAANPFGWSCMLLQFALGLERYTDWTTPSDAIAFWIYGALAAVLGCMYGFKVWPSTVRVLLKLNHKHNREIAGL